MKKTYLILAFAISPVLLMAQHSNEEAQDTSWKNVYRASSTLWNDLVHTKLDVKFDYANEAPFGE